MDQFAISQMLGNYGEFVGAIAVVVTLGYLAAQIRHSNVAMRVAAKQEITRQYADFTDILLKYPDLRAVHHRGLRGDLEDPNDLERFHLLMNKVAWYFDSMVFQKEVGKLSEDEWYQSRELIRRYCGRPGFAGWWRENRQAFRPGFARFIDEHLGDARPLAARR